MKSLAESLFDKNLVKSDIKIKDFYDVNYTYIDKYIDFYNEWAAAYFNADKLKKDTKQSTIVDALKEIILNLPALQETSKEFADRIQKLVNNSKIVIQQSEVAFGIKMLEKNGDFADGINAFLGVEMAFGEPASFASFDKKAIKLLSELGVQTVEL